MTSNKIVSLERIRNDEGSFLTSLMENEDYRTAKMQMWGNCWFAF